MKEKTYKKVFVITEDKSEGEWSYWCENDDKTILYVNEDCTVGEEYSKGNVMIILDGRNFNKTGVDKVIDEINEIENCNDATIKGNIAFAVHNTQDKLDDNFKDKQGRNIIKYTITGKGERKERWNKLFKPIAEAIKCERVPFFKKRFERLLDHCNGKPVSEIPWPWSDTLQRILRIFLPLDIDMQALSDKKVDKEKYLQEMAKDLDELYSSKEKKNIHYRRKLYDLWYLLGKKQWLNENKLEYSPELEDFAPIEEPTSEELCKFAGVNSGKPDVSFSIRNFLNILDTNTLENKVKEICKFNITVPGKENNKTEAINTFHEWYCKLGEYLKKDEV